MTFLATITRYHGKTGNTTMEVHIPSRITRTGDEDHFGRAYEDVSQVLAGMRALDEALEAAKSGGADWTIRYILTSLRTI